MRVITDIHCGGRKIRTEIRTGSDILKDAHSLAIKRPRGTRAFVWMFYPAHGFATVYMWGLHGPKIRVTEARAFKAAA